MPRDAVWLRVVVRFARLTVASEGAFYFQPGVQ